MIEQTGLENLGVAGLMADIPPHELPPQAWSSGANVRFDEGSAQKFSGHGQVYSGNTIAPHYLLQVKDGSNLFWVYPSLTKCFVADGSTHTDITRVSGDYNADADMNWTGGVLGNIPYLNNGVDYPQVWNPASLAQKLVDLPNWPANTTCESLRHFKQFLIAMNVTKSGTKYSHMVKWSNSAAFNSVPSTWDETDATQDAGEYNLSETGDAIVDGMTLGDSFLIYKENSIYGMQYIGPVDIFRFYKISGTHGALSRSCIQEFERQHFVFGAQDCFVTDGQSFQPVLNKRMRRYVYNTIDTNNLKRAFVAVNHAATEMWACYPTEGATYCNQAVIWNWKNNTLGVRDLPEVTHITHGTINSNIGPTSWDAMTVTWDEATATWDYKDYNPADYKLLMASPGNSKIYLADATSQYDGTGIGFCVERTGLFDQTMHAVKRCVRVYPKIQSTGAVKIYVGAQMGLQDPVEWQGPFLFDPSTQYKVDCRISGRLFGFRVESSDNIDIKVSGYQLEYIDAGRH